MIQFHRRKPHKAMCENVEIVLVDQAVVDFSVQS